MHYVWMCVLVLIAAVAGAQTPAPAPTEPTWGSIWAGLINTTAVLVVVQVCKTYLPTLRVRMPAFLPILAGALGPAIALLQNRLATRLGYPIDLSPILALFTGAAATMVNQTIKQGLHVTSRVRRLLG